MFTQLTNETFAHVIADTQYGVLLIFKNLCPHCKNMEKVLEKFSKKVSDVAFYCLDSERDNVAMKALEVERVPTVLIIKNGHVINKKAGLMNPREMLEFYKQTQR
ncbi:MAG: thioredoxin family protein [Desulfopila sp.]